MKEKLAYCLTTLKNIRAACRLSKTVHQAFETCQEIPDWIDEIFDSEPIEPDIKKMMAAADMYEALQYVLRRGQFKGKERLKAVIEEALKKAD